jgi:hypothetical protein
LTHAPLHVVSREPQLVWHRPRLHTWLDAHALPHAPQLSWSLDSSWQASPQNVSAEGHLHAPDKHVCPAPHGRPHAPQF